MSVISTHPDRENLEFTVVAEFDTTPERLWQIWEDPRKLEKWWGPPTWPATFKRHDFREGGEANYTMTGPNGEESSGYWRFKVIQSPNRLEIEDGFADEDGQPNEDMPAMTMQVSIEPAGAKTRMTTVSRFASLEDLDKVLEMGMEEGIKQSVSQIDALL